MTSFKHRARAEQLIDFAGLSWNKLRPTDIDLSLDWGNKTFVFVEVKGIHRALTIGQRIHLEGLVKGLRAGDKTAHALVAKHSTRAHEDIIAADCIVSSYYDGNNWSDEYTNATLGDTMNHLNDLHNEEYPK